MDIRATLFELAIYRVDPESWTQDAETRIELKRQEYRNSFPQLGKIADTRATEIANRVIRFNERPVEWEYNEVIGWLRVIWAGPGPVIKGYVWQVGHPRFDDSIAFRRRYQRGFKPYPFVGGYPICKALEDDFYDDQSNQEIFSQLRETILNIVGSQGWFPNRYIDLHSFDSVGPHLNWHAILRLRR